MSPIRLRPVRAEDLPALTRGRSPEADPWDWFGHRPSNGFERRFHADGLISDDHGVLAVETEDATLVGEVSWFAVQHGPSSACRAFNIGISLFPEHRGKGYGRTAQAALADYMFRTTLVDRLEAGTDVENVPEQRALEGAGFTREGILRHAQYRNGQWRDLVLYSRLREDPAPPERAR